MRATQASLVQTQLHHEYLSLLFYNIHIVSFPSSKPAVLQPSFSRSLTTEKRRKELNCVGNSLPAKEWKNHFKSFSALSHGNCYPSDFGLPRVESLNLTKQKISSDWRHGDRGHEIWFHPRVDLEEINLNLKNDQLLSGKEAIFQEPIPFLHDDHFYTRIHSLRSGIDHQYESLGTVCQEHRLGNDLCLKSVSLPVLDDFNGETEI